MTADPSLQFGHGFGAVDNSAPKPKAKKTVVLQFGHGFGAVDNVFDADADADADADFNSATALGPWITPGHLHGRERGAGTSIRPRLWGRG